MKEHRRWEKVPNKREPITINMIQHWHASTKDSPPDSFQSALLDWSVLGILAGFRKSEWIQDTFEYRKNSDFKRNVDSTVSAFIASDFQLSSVPKSTKVKTLSTDIPSQLKIRWRFQKNNQNGQIITFTRNDNNPVFCPVRAAMRILKRAKRLQVPLDHPLAVFASATDTPIFIHHSLVEKEFRTAATSVYDIRNPSTLKLFSCHSLRVGAAVLLHANQADPLYIQFRLRWRSTSFIEYLRNTPRIAALHNNIINTINTDDTTISQT